MPSTRSPGGPTPRRRRVAGPRPSTAPTPPAPDADVTADSAESDTDEPKDEKSQKLKKSLKQLWPILAGFGAFVLMALMNYQSKGAVDSSYMDTYTPCMKQFNDDKKCDHEALDQLSSVGGGTTILVIFILIWVVLTIARLKTPEPKTWKTKLLLSKILWFILSGFTALYLLIWTINMF